MLGSTPRFALSRFAGAPAPLDVDEAERVDGVGGDKAILVASSTGEGVRDDCRVGNTGSWMRSQYGAAETGPVPRRGTE